MLEDPLLQKNRERNVACFTKSACVFFIVAIIFSRSIFQSAALNGIAVGMIQAGDFVRVKTSDRLGLVTRITDGEWANVFLLDSSTRELRELTRLQALELVPSSQEFRQDPEHSWPYWEFIKQDIWYTQRTCLGPLPGFCRTYEHHCSHVFPMFFNRLIPTLQQTPHNISFGYEGIEFTRDQNMFIEFVRKLFGGEASRLYVIDISVEHTFLIEQYGNEFRIYQSWKNSFDLQYWTNPDISISHMCEPGDDVWRAMHEGGPGLLSHLQRMGIQDDSASIKDAKKTYGGLKSIAYIDIMELFLGLSIGFQMQSMKDKFGADALVVSANMALYSRTKRILGKSAINLEAMALKNMDFTISITFIEYSH